MSGPDVSVLMPVYNAERWIGQALDSLLTQQVDFEVLVLDDASTDAGPEIASGSGDPRVRVVSLDKTGIVGALNAGLRLARAPFLARMDADDVSAPDRLAAQLALMTADPGLVMVGCSYEYIDVAGTRLSVVAPPTRDEDLRRRMHVQTPYAHGSFFMRAADVRRVGTYSAGHASAEDFDLVQRLSREGRLGSAHQVLYRMRVHDSNTSSGVREAERSAASRVRAAVWRDEDLRPLSPVQVRRRAREYARLDPGGPAVAAQFVRTELLLATALARRGRRQAALLTAASVLGAPFEAGVVLRDAPARLREVRRHRRR